MSNTVKWEKERRSNCKEVKGHSLPMGGAGQRARTQRTRLNSILQDRGPCHFTAFWHSPGSPTKEAGSDPRPEQDRTSWGNTTRMHPLAPGVLRGLQKLTGHQQMRCTEEGGWGATPGSCPISAAVLARLWGGGWVHGSFAFLFLMKAGSLGGCGGDGEMEEAAQRAGDQTSWKLQALGHPEPCPSG